jgi:gluconokinase
MGDEGRSTPGPPLVLVLMGVSGCGKTTVAEALADRLGWASEEGDTLHPKANVEKMASGHPLDDADRAPWLAKVADWIEGQLDAGDNGVITCSALKRGYRDVLNRRGTGVEFVYLAGDKALISERLQSRKGHFMPPGLLDSQLDALEEPTPDEPAVRVDITPPPSVIAEHIIDKLGLRDRAERKSS